MNKKKSILESNVLYTIIAIIAGFLIGAIFLMIAGISPAVAWKAVQQHLQQTEISGMDVSICKSTDLYRSECGILVQNRCVQHRS